MHAVNAALGLIMHHMPIKRTNLPLKEAERLQLQRLHASLPFSPPPGLGSSALAQWQQQLAAAHRQVIAIAQNQMSEAVQLSGDSSPERADDEVSAQYVAVLELLGDHLVYMYQVRLLTWYLVLGLGPLAGACSFTSGCLACSTA